MTSAGGRWTVFLNALEVSGLKLVLIFLSEMLCEGVAVVLSEAPCVALKRWAGTARGSFTLWFLVTR